MNALELCLASPDDPDHDHELRRLMREIPMPGSVPLSFQREPSYFLGSAVQGKNPKVIMIRDRTLGTAVALGARVEKLVYVNGEPTRCGYLCDLRIQGSHRGSLTLWRGYRLLSGVDNSDPLPFHLSVIYGDNTTAFRSLLGGRAGIPHYQHRGIIYTPAIFLDRSKRKVTVPNVAFSQAAAPQLPKIISFLEAELAHKQFAPLIHTQLFNSNATPGLMPSDFYIATQGGSLVGVLAAWEQKSFRQVVIEGYPPSLAFLRPLYNSFAPFFFLRSLPPPGEPLSFFYVSYVAVKNNSVEIFRGLLRYMYLHRRGGPWSFCVAGLHERDPLNEVLQEYRRIDASGHLFLVYYQEQDLGMLRIDNRIPYFEMACA